MPSRPSSPPSRPASAISSAASPLYDVVVRDVPATFVASLRRIVPDYGAVEAMFAEIAQALPDTTRVAGHGAVWHRCAPRRREIDCEAMVLLERPTPRRAA